MNRDQLREAVLGTEAWKKAGFINEAAAPVQEQEVIEEAKAEETAPEAHTCPLCESHLEEEISDEALLEHAGQMYSVFEEAEQLLAEAEEAEEGEELSEEEELEEVDLLEGLDEEEILAVAEAIEDMKKAKAKAAKKDEKK